MHTKFRLAIITLAVAAAVAACGHRPRTDRGCDALESDSLPSIVKTLIRAVADGDSVKFAEIVSYPLLRPYPLHDITDAAAMRRAYSTIVDDSLRNVIVDSPASDWQEYGWRGWSVADGRYVWVDESLYDINYLSAAEKAQRDALVKAELASLAPELRGDWSPVACLTASPGKAVYRIDVTTAADASPVYRLTVYADRDAMRLRPVAVMTGHKETEGTASISTYHFKSKDGATATYLADIPDDALPSIEFTSPTGSDTTVTVAAAYWLDLLPKK